MRDVQNFLNIIYPEALDNILNFVLIPITFILCLGNWHKILDLLQVFGRKLFGKDLCQFLFVYDFDGIFLALQGFLNS